MTVAEAIAEVLRVGAVEVSGSNLRLKLPESMRTALQPAIDTLRTGKAEALARLAQPAVLNRAGVRIMALEGGATIGVWSDLDGVEIRAALRSLGPDRLPVRYLDGAGVPMRYKVRRVEREPVPMNVPAEMERHPAEPWGVRDRMLNEMGWCSKGIPWAEWKAAALNRLFQEQGVTGRPGRIMAATVRHSERKEGRS